MVVARAAVGDIGILDVEIEKLLSDLGTGIVEGVAYDTAWVARLATRYPGYGFEQSLEWLRWNQHADGTWGAPLVHYHDRFVSTLAAIIALREAERVAGDDQRIKHGEAALWQLVGKLGRDDSDTVGFPIISTALAEEALALGLDVPMPPIRYAKPYWKKVDKLLQQETRDWRLSPLSFSLEALRSTVAEHDCALSDNHLVGISPSATAGYLMAYKNEKALSQLAGIISRTTKGIVPALAHIDVFETAWAINHLGMAGAIQPYHPAAKRLLGLLERSYSSVQGASFSANFAVTDIDDTAAVFSALRWGGYRPDPMVFTYFEMDNMFSCYHGETNPSLSANVRLLRALRFGEDHPRREEWITNVLHTLRALDENGSFWWDKWHSSPYYVTSDAIAALHGLADDLVQSRLKWMLRTQNRDGGWGYLGESTPEETAYCLEALIYWDRTVKRIDTAVLDAAARFLRKHLGDSSYTPLWIGKSLYTPRNTVRAAILGALYSYMCRDQ